MSSYSDLAQIAQQTDFQNRVRTALFSAAVSAYNESAQAVGHAARQAFAIKVLNGQYDILSVASAVLTNATIATEARLTGPSGNSDGNGNAISDTDLQSSMNSVYGGLAGA